MDTEASTNPQRRIPIRYKLLVGLAVPVVFVALLSGSQVKRAQDDLNRTRRQTDLALAVGGPGEYITALMDERNISAIELLGTGGTVKVSRVTSVPQARKITDQAQTAFEKALDRGGSQVRQIYGPRFDNARKQLVSARRAYDRYTGPRSPLDKASQDIASSVYDTYNGFITGFDAANAEVIARIDDAVLRNRAQSIAQQTIASNLLSVLSRRSAQPVLQQSELNADQRADVAQLFDQYKASQTQAIRGLDGDPAAQKVVFNYFGKPHIKAFEASIRKLMRDGTVADAPMSDMGAQIAAVTQTMSNAGDPSHPNSSDVWDAGRVALKTWADALIGASQTSRNWYVAVFVFATLISLAVALAIARSIAGPLRSIAAQADDMANTRLPAAVGSVLATPIGQDIVEPELEPIKVATNDEVSDVATSINVVQQRALDLAVEQAAQRKNFADTFLNLGRRVQGLVARQLDFITELEDAEDDPDVLADLFKLDHLATRIRRNAESLVVLAGVTRRQRRGEPAPVLDALRSALGEVDEYTRVDIGRVDEAILPMSVAADLAHILAELIENGLNFSPPESDVEVSGHLGDDGYEITVRDRGIGMSAEQIATANRRLSGNESFTVAPSRYMGHFVAGDLATGLGIDIRLASAGQGTVATVTVPSELLVRRNQGSERAGDPVGAPQDAARAAPPIPEHEDGTSTGTGNVRTGSSFQPAAPPPAPVTSPGTESLKSLLTVHRRLSQPGSPPEPDRSPWADGDHAPDGEPGETRRADDEVATADETGEDRSDS